jgi:hypothetical protein
LDNSSVVGDSDEVGDRFHQRIPRRDR